MKREYLLYAIFGTLIVIMLQLKINLEVDETWTYGLANNVGAITIEVEQGEQYSPADIAYKEFMTVESGEAFNYVNVWNNQSSDVHPPLYYILVHTISSFFQGKFSIWFAGSINIVFGLLTLWIIRKILYLFESDLKVINAISLLMILSAGMLNATAFLRMYIVCMFFVALITYLFIKNAKSLSDGKFWIITGVVTVLGTLTHYYFLVYLFFLCLVFVIVLLISRKMKEIGQLLLTMGISGGVSVGVFPAMLTHIFGSGAAGYRGQESIDNFTKTTFSDYCDRLKIFYAFINEQLFGGILTYLVIFILFFWVCIFVINGKEKKKLWEKNYIKENFFSWLLLVVPSLCYFLLVSRIAVYSQERYLHPIYPMLIVAIGLLCFGFIKNFYKSEYYIITCILFVIMLVNSWTLCSWKYLWSSTQEALQVAEEYSEEDVLFIYSMARQIQPAYYEIRKYQSVTYLEEKNIDLLADVECITNDSLVVYIANGCDANKILNNIIDFMPSVNAYKKLSTCWYTTSYYLYGKDIEVTSYEIYDYSKERTIGCEEETLKANVCMEDEKNIIKCVQMLGDEYANLYLGGLALDIENAKFQADNNIQLYNFSLNNDAQKWKVLENIDGTYTIFSVDNNLVLANKNGNICLAIYNSEDVNQKWWLEKSE